jgi:DNA repair protein RecN (Recombination protein N)
MISYLSITNFGLFSQVSLELRPGLTVLTGETGAGKSMVVDAVMACLGQRTSKELIRTGEERAVIELLVALPPELPLGPDNPLADALLGAGEVVLQKDVLAERSYLRVNGRLATAAMAQDLGGRLVDIHGQQEHHSLMRPQNYLGILDSLKKDAVEPLRKAFNDLYRRRQETLGRMSELDKGERERQREMDLLSFQAGEISQAKLRPSEEEELRQEYAVLSSQERLVELVSGAYDALYDGGRGAGRPAYEGMDQAISDLRKVQAIDPSVRQALDATQQAVFDLEAALDLIRDYRRKLAISPDRLRAVSERLDFIQRLRSKYGETVEKIVQFAAAASRRLDELAHADETLRRLREEADAVDREMASVGARLTAARGGIAEAMEQDVSVSLKELGMPGGKFMATLEGEGEPGPYGFDKVSFLFSANPGEPAMPVNRVASGGELSRLMLAIKSHMEAVDPVPTVIFDEIDAGIGGKAGQAIGEKLWGLGRRHQIFCVTHLASIASLADNHLLVSKEEREGRTYATVRPLSGDERAREIARMLSGRDLDISLEHARELIRASEEYKKQRVAQTAE